MFDLITDLFDEGLSMPGVIFGLLCFGFTFVLRKQMLNPFTEHMAFATGIFWTVATYATCFVVGYMVGVKMFDE